MKNPETIREQEPIASWRVEATQFDNKPLSFRRFTMGRGILLWLLGIPLPIVILLVLFMR
ncbi:hypothetical protein PMI07_002550 [Rhizobium sp. CF080]|uniref:hypothetical protein n=1 Tax=Rhizobium sp. (strain CF080) TaxID=1144310 RepID=UPI00027167E9|nr:hypothetical protein [Rhizobium sp. CF080]EUB96062.1 hypothetical protein PMI07_002550 [Rhizobium sp. CF080]